MTFSIAEIVSPAADTCKGDLAVERLFICTTPRCAGHTLCSDLRAVGVGVPAEYFGSHVASPMAKRLGLTVDELSQLPEKSSSYAQKIVSLRSNSGVFSAKLFFRDLRFVRRCFPDLDDVTYLYLRRSDLVSQTISLFALLLSSRPFDSDETIDTGLGQIACTHESAARIYVWLVRQNLLWREYLSNKKRVYFLDSSVFLNDRLSTMTAISHLVGASLPALDFQLRQGVYRIDRDIKRQLRNSFGKMLLDMDASQAPFSPPPNAVPIC